MTEVSNQMKDFLQFITLQFIKHPDKAQLCVAEASEEHIRFRLILHHTDVAILIGKNGFTASAIRNVLKAAAMREGISATLQIISHEEEQQRLASIEAGTTNDEDREAHNQGSQGETDDEHLEE